MGGLGDLRLSLANELKGAFTINLPTSKSISNRLLIIRALSKGRVEIENLSAADDTVFLNKALSGATDELWMGDGGTAIRFGLAWAAVSSGTRIIRGSAHLSSRPISGLVNALNSLGAQIDYLEGNERPPLRVMGSKLKGGKIKLDGSLSSQFVSAIMLVAPYFSDSLDLELEENQVSVPYIEMTFDLMKKAGADISWEGRRIRINPKAYKPTKFVVEADWSSASYFYSWAALNPDLVIRIPHLSSESMQGDRASAEIFKDFGVDTSFDEFGATLRRNRIVNIPEELNCLEFPDLAQTIAVAGAALNKNLKLTGLQTLRVKETDRIHALEQELRACGTNSRSDSDSLSITNDPIALEETPRIKTYGDHRMAMAFAPMVSKLRDIKIENYQVVSKSFPGYWEEVEKLGVHLTKI